MIYTFFTHTAKAVRVHNPLFGESIGGIDWQEAATYLNEVEAFTGRKAKLGKAVCVEMGEDRNIERVLLGQQVTKPKGDDRKLY